MSTVTPQKEAVVEAVKEVLGSSFDTSLSAKDQLNTDQVGEVRRKVFEGIMNGDVALAKSGMAEKDIKRYVSGMVSNHFRKAKELNGGATYKPSTSRPGSRDPKIAEMTKLQSKYDEGSDQFNEVQTAIDCRFEDLKQIKADAAKEKKLKSQISHIDQSILPPDLQELAAGLQDASTSTVE